MDRKVLRFELFNMKDSQVQSFDVHLPEGRLTSIVCGTIYCKVLPNMLQEVVDRNMRISIKQVT